MNVRHQLISSSVPKAEGSAPIWSLDTERLADVKPQPVNWVVRAPDGKGFLTSGLTLIVGDPGAGKSTLVRAIIACVTTGEGSFQSNIGKVLYLCWEDDEASLVLPLLLSCGGDPRAVDLVRGIRNDIGGESQFLPIHLGLVREHLERNLDCRMIVVDVLASLTTLGQRNSDRSEDIRSLLDPFHKLGLELGVAVVVLHHQNKRTTEGALNRVAGSVQISGTARLVWAVGADPDDPDIRRVALVKANTPGRCENGFAFREVPADRARVVAHAQSCGVILPEALEDDVFRRLEIVEGLDHITANDLARGASRQGKELSAVKAETWLRQYLAEHGEASDHALREAATTAGIGRDALNHAKKAMKEAGAIRMAKQGVDWWVIATAPLGKTFDDVFGE